MVNFGFRVQGEIQDETRPARYFFKLYAQTQPLNNRNQNRKQNHNHRKSPKSICFFQAIEK